MIVSLLICGEVLTGSLYLQLLWELELQISKLTKNKCTSDVFIDHWKALSTCFLDGSDIYYGMSKNMNSPCMQ